jgi:histidinol-phosphate aminotransferase
MKIPVPSHIQKIRPYVPGKPIAEVERELGLTGTIKMASNESPLGPSPKAVDALRGFLDQIHIYPEGSGFYLREALGRRFGIPQGQVILGNGSVELVEIAARALLHREANAVFSAGSFAMYPIACQIAAAPTKPVPMMDRNHDLQAILDAIDDRTRLVILDNPINPTGRHLALRDIEHFLERVPESTLVILDEAYKEFVDAPDYGSAQSLMARFPNLMVLGTFSKAYGLAALRIGYGFAHPETLVELNKARSPFNTSSLAQVAAIAALDDQEYVARYVALNLAERAYLARGTAALGLPVTPSVANFIFVDAPMPADEAFYRLMREGIIVRPMAGNGWPNSLRVTVYTRDGNARFLTAAKKVFGL